MPTDQERTCRSGHLPQVLVLQNGARHNYAVPEALARRGMLAGFYTDICGNEGLGRLSAMFPAAASMLRLAKRQVPESVRPVTHSFPLATKADQMQARLSGGESDLWISGALKRAGLRGAEIVYSSLGWAGGFLKQARQQGVRVVNEFYVKPSYEKLHLEEHLKFPEWEAQKPVCREFVTEEARLGFCAYSDALIVPSEAVKKDLVLGRYMAAEHIHVVPYGISKEAFQTHSTPQPGKVVFAGSCTLMKGIHYYAMAAAEVAKKAATVQPEFLAAGHVTSEIQQQPVCSAITFLGRLPRQEMKHLYATADVLVFPTLSDSFGAVMLEAMAAGIPVVSSPYCAEVVEDGVSGFIVEPRDTTELADAILKIVEDRALRARMSEAAKARASLYTWESFGSILADKISQLA